jgi:hypothetical protein
MHGDLLAPASWACGLLLIALTIAIHATGVVMMSFAGAEFRLRLEHRSFGPRRVIPIAIGMVSAVGMLLAMLHGMEATIWAAAYLWLGAFGSPTDAMLYSLGAMTTAGAPGVTLEGHWRTVGGLESAGGVLLFGISTAYMFAVMHAYWPMLARRQ